MPTPPEVPSGHKLNSFGHIIMRWGQGHVAARARIETLSREELEAAGVTWEMASEWRDFYIVEAAHNPKNPSAQGRAELMAYAAELLED